MSSIPQVLNVTSIAKQGKEIQEHNDQMASVTKKLNYFQPVQQQNNWCWAAFTVGIHLYFSPGAGTTQCSVVNSGLGRNDCCAQPASAACDQPQWPDDVLRNLGNLRQKVNSSISFDAIEQEIYLKRSNPVGCYIAWRGGGAHMVVVYGYAVHDFDGYIEMYVFVRDPWDGSTTYLSYNNFENAYQGTGQWKLTYLTQS